MKCDDRVFTYNVSKFICRWYCSVNRRLRFFLGLTTFVASIGSSISCPDGKLSCPNAFTCCLLPSGEYGCCPYPKVHINAVDVVQVIWIKVFQQFPAFFIFLCCWIKAVWFLLYWLEENIDTRVPNKAKTSCVWISCRPRAVRITFTVALPTWSVTWSIHCVGVARPSCPWWRRSLL